MSDSQVPEPQARPVGGTEYSWCKAVPSGTGITVLALLLSNPPDVTSIQSALHNLQNHFPILRSKLRFDAAANSFSFLTPSSPSLQIKQFDLDSTQQILQSTPNLSVSAFQRIVEHELNQNEWRDPYSDADVFFASVYALGEAQRSVVFRLHTATCDRTSAAAVLRELLRLLDEGIRNGVQSEREKNYGFSLGIESLVPSGKANKPFWARGVDLLGYSLNSFRHAHIDFVDAASPRSSQVVRLQMNQDETQRLLSGCKSRGIKICGALVAAGLIAAHSSKNTCYQREKYAIVTLTDTRSVLDPALRSYDLGFYHSAILNTHDVSDEDNLWELATRTYTAFANAKNSNKHLTDMADLNLLMCKAIENPGLTTSSSLRTSSISIFEDPVIDVSDDMHKEIGLEDCIGCSSVHGVGPSIAIFDTIRDGCLDCICVYPSPLHSRDQMLALIDKMKKILVDDRNYV